MEKATLHLLLFFVILNMTLVADLLYCIAESYWPYIDHVLLWIGAIIITVIFFGLLALVDIKFEDW